MRRALLLLLLATACTTRTGSDAPRATARADEVRVLYTSDEHGWLDPWKDRDANVYRGGAQLLKAHLQRDGLGRGDVVLLSGGDNWTGPYVSTSLRGQPMVEVMNALGYRAAVLGNHEFDFGVRALARRSAEANFPYLSANLYQEAARGLPRWIKASAILEVGGRRLGVVGLSTTKTPQTTDPRHVVGHRFLPYDETLRDAVPRARADGAEVVMVAIHDGLEAGLSFTPTLRELGVHLVALGHEHAPALYIDDGGTPEDPTDDITFCNPGGMTRTYCVIDVDLRGERPRFTAELREVTAPVDGPLPEDPQLRDIIEAARARADAMGDEVLARAPDGLSRAAGLGQLVVDSWLARFPDVDVAISNRGGFRQDIPPGEVRTRDLISTMPFSNYLVIVELTGAQLAEALASEESVFGGVSARREGDALVVVDKGGKRVGAKQQVRAVINDFIYRGGDGFRFRAYDPEPEETSVDWREPVIQVLRAAREEGRAIPDEADKRDRR